ncbi:MAG: hypothetical protein Sw1PiTSA_12030 [Shewanella algae]
MAFSFKAFHIEDYGCGMPVSTDGVLLGAWAPLTGAKRVLDIGAGSGLLSLMAAQRSEAEVLAVELDSSAAHASRANFKASPWASRLALYQGSIQAYCDEHALADSALFDHILCNPPYFETGPRSDDPKRAIARHTEHLNFDELCGDKAITQATGTGEPYSAGSEPGQICVRRNKGRLATGRAGQCQQHASKAQ